MPWPHDSIFRIEIIGATGAVTSVGTGFLVGPDLVLTAMHVVADRAAETLAPLSPSIRVRLGGEDKSSTREVDFVEGYWDPVDDWALLRVKGELPPVVPLTLVRLAKLGKERRWRTRGFPPKLKADGVTIDGRVQEIYERVGDADALQLYSDNAAAGIGAPVEGFSGSPIIVGPHVVGVMRSALLRTDKPFGGKAVELSQAGILYACPIESILARCALLTEASPTIDAMTVMTVATSNQTSELSNVIGRVATLFDTDRMNEVAFKMQALVGALPAAGDAAFLVQLAAACLGNPSSLGLLLEAIAASADWNKADEGAAVSGLAAKLQELFPHAVPWALSLRLKNILAAEPATSTEALRQALADATITGGLVGSGGLPAILDRLAAQNPAGGVPPLLRFVARLTPRGEALSDWLDAATTAADVADRSFMQPTPPPVTTKPKVVIIVAPDQNQPDDPHFTIEGHVFKDNFSDEITFAKKTFPRTDLSKLAAEIYSALNKLNSSILISAPCIELFLPFDLMGSDVDARAVGSLKFPAHLGERYAFVIRSWNRYFDGDLKADLVVTWNEFLAHLSTAAIRWIDDAPTMPELLKYLKREKASCIALNLLSAGVPAAGGDEACGLLEEIVHAGVPAAICLRQPVTDSVIVRQTFVGLAEPGQMDCLPASVLKLRKEAWESSSDAHLGRHVTLLWDLTALPQSLEQPRLAKPIN